MGLHFELFYFDVGPFFGSENCSAEYRFNRLSTDWTTGTGTPRCITTGAIIALPFNIVLFPVIVIGITPMDTLA